jgi:general stress protein 26
MSRDILDTARKLVEKNRNVMVGSVDEEGYPNIKMMFNTRDREGIRVFYLTTNTSSLRARQFLLNPKACLYFANTRFFNGLLLMGRMEVLQDDASKRKIWRAGDEMYYPLGVTDPDYCVFRFTAQSGRYYAHFKSVDFTVE